MRSSKTSVSTSTGPSGSGSRQPMSKARKNRNVFFIRGCRWGIVRRREVNGRTVYDCCNKKQTVAAALSVESLCGKYPKLALKFEQEFPRHHIHPNDLEVFWQYVPATASWLPWPAPPGSGSRRITRMGSLLANEAIRLAADEEDLLQEDDFPEPHELVSLGDLKRWIAFSRPYFSDDLRFVQLFTGCSEAWWNVMIDQPLRFAVFQRIGRFGIERTCSDLKDVLGPKMIPMIATSEGCQTCDHEEAGPYVRLACGNVLCEKCFARMVLASKMKPSPVCTCNGWEHNLELAEEFPEEKSDEEFSEEKSDDEFDCFFESP
eukprot:ANDGO_07282.mRNA.1 hypothetical protein